VGVIIAAHDHGDNLWITSASSAETAGKSCRIDRETGRKRHDLHCLRIMN
jgi:hypothetical protein